MQGKPLEGIRVLDVTQFLSGPFCTMTLANLGAEVIKVERPGIGDATRTDIPTRSGTSAMYVSCNQGKKSMILDLKNPAHKEIFLQLVEKSDVVAENFKPGTMEKLGLHYEKLRERKKDIIYLAISGYGQTGPYKYRGALDIAIQAMSGFMSITGEKNGKPSKSGASLADVVSGLYGVIGVLAAVINRSNTGEGQYLDVAMMDVMAASIMQNSIARYCLNDVVPKPQGNRHPASAPFQEFDTEDGSIVICCPTNAQFKSLMEGLGHAKVYEDELFHDTEMRYAHKDELAEVLTPIIAAWKTERLAKMMEERGLSFGEINSIDAVVNNEQLKARNMIVHVEEKNAGQFRTTGFPIKMDCLPDETDRRVPALGEDTEQILEKLLDIEKKTVDELLAGYRC